MRIIFWISQYLSEMFNIEWQNEKKKKNLIKLHNVSKFFTKSVICVEEKWLFSKMYTRMINSRKQRTFRLQPIWARLGPRSPKLSIDLGAAQVWYRSSRSSSPAAKYGIQRAGDLVLHFPLKGTDPEYGVYREHQIHHLLPNFQWKNCYST